MTLTLAHTDTGLSVVKRDGRPLSYWVDDYEAMAYIQGFKACAMINGLCCDHCGDTGEIRSIPQPYGAADRLCGECFARVDAENSFTDFQEAAQ